MIIPMTFSTEIAVFILLLCSVILVYFLLKLHYIFAFRLMEKTSLYSKYNKRIEVIKKYFFITLKFLLFISLISMFTFCSTCLIENKSLTQIVIDFWSKIPQEFWSDLFLTLLRIAILIVLMRYILKIIYNFLERQKEKSLLKKRYNTKNVELVYLRVHNTLKYTVVLGVVYRIVHFFPFLEEVSFVFLAALILFFILASLMTLKEVLIMRKTNYINEGSK